MKSGLSSDSQLNTHWLSGYRTHFTLLMQEEEFTHYDVFMQNLDPSLRGSPWNVFPDADTQTGYYAGPTTQNLSGPAYSPHPEPEEAAPSRLDQKLAPVVQSDRSYPATLSSHHRSPDSQRMGENEPSHMFQAQEWLDPMLRPRLQHIEAPLANLDHEFSLEPIFNGDTCGYFEFSPRSDPPVSLIESVVEPDTHDETTAIPTPPASQSENTSTKSKRFQKRVKHAEYTVPIKVVPQLPWKLQLSVKKTAEPAVPNSMFTQKSPYVWAETTEDILFALQTYPDIFESDGIGTEGSCLNHLILDGRSWQDIEWVNPYTFVVKRAWKFSKRKKRTRQTEAPFKSYKTRKRNRLDESNFLEDGPLFGEDASAPFIPGGGEVAVSSQTEPHFAPDALNGHDENQHYHAEDEIDDQSAVNTQNPGPNDERHPAFISPGSEHALPVLENENTEPRGAFDEASLPQEAQLFRTALQTRHPISIFLGNDLHLFQGILLNPPWKYAFMGFFLVTNFEEKDFWISENQDTGSSELLVTFEWIGNGSIWGHPHPWWISPDCIFESVASLSKNVNDIDQAICSNLTCFSHISLYPKSNADQSDVGFDDGDSDDVCIQADFPSCWLCRRCGKLNAVVPFRLRWSWVCRHCEAVGRSLENVYFEPTIFQEAYHLPPPLPLEDPKSPVKHDVRFFKHGERVIVYSFRSSDIVLRHIPSIDEDSQTEIESLYGDIQRCIDFEPCDTDPSLLKFNYSWNKADPVEDDVTFLIKTFNSLIQDRPGLVDQSSPGPHDLRCFFWPSKGTTKPHLLLDRHVVFIALGSTCELRFIVKRNGSGGKEESCKLTLDMPHCGILVFSRCDDATVTYKVFRTGRLLLLTSCWNDVENLVLSDETAVSNQISQHATLSCP